LTTKNRAHKEFIGRLIVKLFKGTYIAVSIGQKAGYGSDYTATRATGTGENIVVGLLGHGGHINCLMLLKKCDYRPSLIVWLGLHPFFTSL
jgi:hypothetical protein